MLRFRGLSKRRFLDREICWHFGRRRQLLGRWNQMRAFFGVGIERNFGGRSNRGRRQSRCFHRNLYIFDTWLSVEADQLLRKANRLCNLQRFRRPANEVPHRRFQIMQKFERSRTAAIVGFHARDQLIPRTGFNPQFQIGNVVGGRVGRNNFDGVTAGKQIERQLS